MARLARPCAQVNGERVSASPAEGANIAVSGSSRLRVSQLHPGARWLPLGLVPEGSAALFLAAAFKSKGDFTI